ncbi:RIB43A-like with coiled-coils protein 2 [Perognathus longimembris pacificus]|uniref:RIB43A-like with coiled-coils protein 2 n=1 Tax=Perognathus longimembris pacificus TaxID=214514 RepID=UPI00201982A9|nr:RIB43A-like with coiled-coils protein 2 [Perognathus longimembris pacificus]
MSLTLPKDLLREAGLAKRRHAEQARLKRIFNARDRITGGDTHAWNAQIQEQKLREATEKTREETYAAEIRHNDKVMCIVEGRERRDKKNFCKFINDFQQNFQKPETRREFDLSDPHALRKALPAGISGDSQNAVMGMHKFMGEDLNFRERKKFQQEQNREWSLQQQQEWERARADHKMAGRERDLHTQARLQADEVAMHLQRLQLATQRAVNAAVKEFNKNQVMELAERKRLKKIKEEEDNQAEISAMLHRDQSSENLEQVVGAFGSQRLIPSCWKGMSQEQLREIRLTQKQQIQEKQRLQEEEQQRSMEWDQQRIQKARATLLHERQQQRLQRDLRRALDSSNLSLAKEQNLQKKYNKEAYINQPTGDYFAQFNTRSR